MQYVITSSIVYFHTLVAFLSHWDVLLAPPQRLQRTNFRKRNMDLWDLKFSVRVFPVSQASM